MMFGTRCESAQTPFMDGHNDNTVAAVKRIRVIIRCSNGRGKLRLESYPTKNVLAIMALPRYRRDCDKFPVHAQLHGSVRKVRERQGASRRFLIGLIDGNTGG
jgi:hypothetical protein